MRDEDHSQQLPQRVRGEDDSQQLPQRVRGAARAGPDRPAQPHTPDRPGMSDDLRQRIQAAVAAERANAAQDTEQAAASSERGNPAGTAEAGEHNPMPQRVRGAARPGPDRPAQPHTPDRPGMSDDLRQRIQAAVAAERANAAQDTEHAAASSERGNAPGTAEAGDHHPVLNPVNRKNGHKPKNGHKTVVQPARGNAPVISGVPPARAPAAAVTGRQDPAPVQPRPAPLPRPQRAVRRNTTRRRRWRFIAVIAVALAAGVGSLVAVAIRPAGHKGGAAASGTAALSPALLRQEAALRAKVATWVAQQVSPGVIVSCDPAMCTALSHDAFPKSSLLVLSPTSPVPLTSAVIVATPIVRDMFGSSLSTATAPGVLASFGSGPAEITVRVIAPSGPAPYWAAVRVDQAARKTNGSALLNVHQITVSAIARRQLAGGQVDSRLLLAVAWLAASEPIDIVQFGNVGSGASPEIPLRFADLAGNDQAAHMTSSAYLRSLRASLNSAVAQFRPARIVQVAVPGGQAVVRVEFTAPSPLDLFGTQGSR
jgi:hypothetical protein